MMNSKLVSGKSTIEIPLKSKKTAELLLAALSPETKSGPSDRATTNVSIRDNVLVIEIEANDITALRAAMNSYIAWVSACLRTVELP
ncbi:MAG: KEOPS complex subunit Pcc1 [Candidatus Thorarchaeota archaeon]|jgi:tRNA threonylcarbamoyladenosine modification (KEOPS) complex  Pcc1 subunit